MLKYLTPVLKKYPFYLKFLNLYEGFVDGIKSIIHLKQAEWFFIYTLHVCSTKISELINLLVCCYTKSIGIYHE